MSSRIQFYIQPNEGLGGRSNRVRAIQEELFYLGFLKTNPDGQYGPNTLKAVKAAQKAYGFEENGIIDVDFASVLIAECIYKNPKDR